MKRAIYAFSGDPITYGHINIIKRAANFFDEVVAGIGVNPGKSYMFTLEERTEMAQKALKDLRNVTVTSFEGLLVDYAYEQDIPVIIKGVRNAADFDYERTLKEVGDSQRAGIETHILFAKPELAQVSSSAVKAIQKDSGAIHEYVPLNVKQNLEARMSGQYILGITGEIGSGKSYVSKKLEEIGKQKKIPTYYIDLDKIGHQILGGLQEPGYQKIRDEISLIFGAEIRTPDGKIDRKALGNIVFNDPEKLKKLNSIMHEPILLRLRREIYNKKGLFLLEAALFAESGITYLCNNNVVLVGVDKESQKSRLTKKRGMSPEQIERRIASQYNCEQKQQILERSMQMDNHGKLWTIDNSDNSDPAQLIALFNNIITHMDKYGELRFRGLWERIGADGTPDDEYKRLLGAYSESHRVYHALPHIIACLDEFEQARHLTEHPDQVEFALWYHDLVMKQKSRVDEERSAQAAQAVCRHILLPEEFAENVKSLILATKHAKVPSGADEKLITDIDLSVFGKSPDDFDAYVARVRKEYSYVPEDEFWSRRASILQKFLDRPVIYSTDFFNKKYEAQAQSNLRKGR